MTAVTVRTWVLTLAVAAGATCVFAGDSLYDRLGGQAGVAAIADELIDRASTDPVMGPAFVDSKLDRIKGLLAEQICDLAGGPCHYTGDPMKEVHAGHHITDGMFNRMVQALRDILDERHIDDRSKNQLLRLLAPMKRDVIEPSAAAHGRSAQTPASPAGAP